MRGSPVTAFGLPVHAHPARAPASAFPIAPWEPLLAVFGLGLVALARLAFLGTDWRSPDAILFFDAARHLAVGAGFTLSIKFHYFTSAQKAPICVRASAVVAAWAAQAVSESLSTAARKTG